MIGMWVPIVSKTMVATDSRALRDPVGVDTKITFPLWM